MWLAGRGEAAYGDFSTLNISESPNAVAACSLSGALEAHVHPRYFLSAEAMGGILRRAERRGRTLPPQLRGALEAGAVPDWRERGEEDWAEDLLELWDRTSPIPSADSPTEGCEPPTSSSEPMSLGPTLTTRYGALGGNDMQNEGAIVAAPETASTLKASGMQGARTSDVEQTIVAGAAEDAAEAPVIGFHTAPRIELQDRPRDDGNAPTLMRGATPGATAPAGLRRLTPTECERLQGWPDGFTALPVRKRKGKAKGRK